MSSFFTILLIAISLSMDAFSLALVYGLLGMDSKKRITLSLIVGLYHFVMPLIGLVFSHILVNLPFNLNIIASLILIYIGVDLIMSSYKEEPKFLISFIGFLMFGLSVSIDSLSVGIILPAITSNYLLSAITFALTSSAFTYIGLISGNIIGNKIGAYSKIVGGITLIIISIILFIA